MIVIPIRGTGPGRGPLVLVLIIEKENLDRMREGDPFDFQPRALGAMCPEGRVSDLDIVVAYEEDLNPIMEFQKANDIDGLIRHLERGRRHKPGDFGPPAPLRRT